MHPLRACFALNFLILAATPVAAQPPIGAGAPATPGVAAPAGKTLHDVWDIAYLDGKRAGYVHLLVKEIPLASGQKYIQAQRELALTVRRFGDIAQVQVTAGTNETPDGKVLGTFMLQGLGRQVTQQVTGTVEGNQLRLTAKGQHTFDKLVPWSDKVLGTYGELNLLKKRSPAPKDGDKFEYQIFEPILNAVVTVRGQVEGVEDVVIANQRARLLRVTAVPDMIEDVQMPGQILWFDAKYEVRRSGTRMPGMGNLVIERGTKEQAMAQLLRDQLPDVNERQSIFLSKRIDNAHAGSEIVYRLTLPQDRDPAKAFATDARQQVRNVKGKSFDLVVRAVRTPPAQAPTGANGPGQEFLSSNFFVTSDDERVKTHAAAAVADESDPWRKALRIERWVNQNMKALNFSEAMAPAWKVAETLAGDCTEYAMLTAAICRAAGLPSRTAVGLVYVEGAKPFLGFHMWTEVYVRGAWVAIDATLAQQGVGPAHLKICDHSWHDTRSMNPLLPIMRVTLGEPKAEVVEVKK